MRTKLIAFTSAIALACASVSPAHAEDGYDPTNVVPGLTATVEPVSYTHLTLPTKA